MQKSFFQLLPRDSLSTTSYEKLFESLQQSWDAIPNRTSTSWIYEPNQRHNQRRLNRRKRKEIGVAKRLRRLDLVSALNLPVVLNHQPHESSVLHVHQHWMVIAKRESLRSFANRWSYKELNVNFSVGSQFGTPRYKHLFANRYHLTMGSSVDSREE